MPVSIVLVEKEDATIRYHTRILEAAGYIVRGFIDVAAAEASIQAQMPSLIICSGAIARDYDGAELAQRLQALNYNVMMYSGLDFRDWDLYTLHKPAHKHLFYDAVEEKLRHPDMRVCKIG